MKESSMASATYTNVIPFPVLERRKPQQPAAERPAGSINEVTVERLKAAARALWPAEYGLAAGEIA
jgi:hypothetical protein